MRRRINFGEFGPAIAGLFVCSVSMAPLVRAFGFLGGVASFVAGNATVAIVKWLQKRGG